MWRLIFPDRPDIVVESLNAVLLDIRSHRMDPQPVLPWGQEPPRSAPYYVIEYALHFLDDQRHLAYYRRVR